MVGYKGNDSVFYQLAMSVVEKRKTRGSIYHNRELLKLKGYRLPSKLVKSFRMDRTGFQVYLLLQPNQVISTALISWYISVNYWSNPFPTIPSETRVGKDGPELRGISYGFLQTEGTEAAKEGGPTWSDTHTRTIFNGRITRVENDTCGAPLSMEER